MNLIFAGYLFLRFKDGHEIRQINPSQKLIKLQYQSWMLPGMALGQWHVRKSRKFIRN